jgi:hypothetical protein
VVVIFVVVTIGDVEVLVVVISTFLDASVTNFNTRDKVTAKIIKTIKTRCRGSQANGDAIICVARYV